VLDEFADVFTERPELCKVGQHEIPVTPDFKPKRLKAYRVPEVLKSEVARQIQELLDLGIIEPSNGEMPSPIVCVLRGQDDENEAQKCHDNWCCSQCIRVGTYSHAICHRMSGSYNACGIMGGFGDSDLHCYQSLGDTLKVGLFIVLA